jgi:NADPH:quinone reductase-like Zn-dependent oxidoreductase
MGPHLRSTRTNGRTTRDAPQQTAKAAILNSMKAAVCSRYGPPHVVLIKDVEKPVPKNDEVLIKVRAASVNPLDWHSMRGSPYVARMMGGLRKPKDTRLGVDVAGQVEAVGKDVACFKPDDEVFGICKGAFAEYACASESALVAKSEQVTFEQAAAVPVAALTALQGLRDKGQIQPGQKVLINGASGGVGTFAVQIARWFGAYVTGVCSSRNVDLVRTLGADQVIDYTREDFTRSLRGYDLFFDCVGNHSLFAGRRILSPKGRLVVITGPDGRWLGPVARLLGALVLSPFASQHLIPFIAKSSKEDLTLIQELIGAGKVTPVIDKCYPLSEVPAALRYLEEGHARGKVVILLDRNSQPG